MKQCSAEQFLEQVELGALVVPLDSRETLAVRVGRWVFAVPAAEFSEAQRAVLINWYRLGRVKIAHPGDFQIAPDWLLPLRSVREAGVNPEARRAYSIPVGVEEQAEPLFDTATAQKVWRRAITERF